MYLDYFQKEDKMKKTMEWKDVTKECTIDYRPNGGYVHIKHEGNIIPLRQTDISEKNGYRMVWNALQDYQISQTFRVEKFTEVDTFVFKYTQEYVEGLDYKNMSAKEVLEHDVKKWNERIEAHKAGVDSYDMPSSKGSTCPSCQAKEYDHCPLGPEGFCGHDCFYEWRRYVLDPSALRAIAVRDYIQDKLDSLPVRPFEQWDKIRDKDGDEGIITKISKSGYTEVAYPYGRPNMIRKRGYPFSGGMEHYNRHDGWSSAEGFTHIEKKKEE